MTIQIVSQKSKLHSLVSGWRAQGMSVGYVPTMGALHAGHLSLVELALAHADKVVVSIFVNPAQFAPGEDLDTYPREEAQDVAKLTAAGAHVVYVPDVAHMYPDGMDDIAVRAGAPAEGLETDFRPHFFDGVVNIVHRLFEHVQPDLAIFGEKDYQQLCVVRDVVERAGMDIEIIGAPIVRDEHGLALSSRNAYLSAAELSVARRLNKALFPSGKR